MTEDTEAKVVPPGMGKWNRKKRKVAAKHPKPKITKGERREKYTAIAKDRQIRKKSKSLVCYNCRETGHSVQHCPKAAGNAESKKKQLCNVPTIICYKCGSTEHALASCPKKRLSTDIDLPFATCYVCQAKGHLASSCPNNSHGIYVNGGACKHCGSNQHRGTACPDKKIKKKGGDNDGGRVEEHDFSDLLEGDEVSKPNRDELTHATKVKKTGKKKRVVNF